MENETKPAQKRSRFSRIGAHIRPKRLLLLVIALALVAVAVAWAGQWYKDYKISQQTVELPSESKFFKNKKEELLVAKPAANAPEKEQLRYYDELRFAYAGLGEYGEAVKAYETRVSISEENFGYLDYLKVAEWYFKDNQKQKALAMLDKAERTVPADNVETGFFSEDVLEYIESKRQEYR